MILPNRYTLEKKIAEGWSSIIYEGSIIADDSIKVVFKHLKDSIAGQDYHGIKKYLFEAMIKEANALASLDHQSIPKFYEVLWLEDRPCIVMQKIEGNSLQLLIEQKKMNWPIVKTISLNILNALQSIHEKGYIHCDLNPNNIIVDESKTYILDFGAVQSERCLPYWAYPLGRHRFMPPEYLLERNDKYPYKSLDATCDFHQLGCLMYNMLTGLQPFRNVEEKEEYQLDYLDQIGIFMNLPIEKKIDYFRVKDVDMINIPVGFSDFLSRALMPKPKDRYQSVKQMTESLLSL